MMEKTKIKEYKELFDNLKNGNQYYRLGKLFSTTEKKYFYDTGTGKIFEIADRVYEVLDAIFDEDTFDAVFSVIRQIKHCLFRHIKIGLL